MCKKQAFREVCRGGGTRGASENFNKPLNTKIEGFFYRPDSKRGVCLVSAVGKSHSLQCLAGAPEKFTCFYSFKGMNEMGSKKLHHKLYSIFPLFRSM